MAQQILILLLIFFCNIPLFSQNIEKTGTANCPREKIQVHLSQQSLFPGQILGFKIYCTSPLFPKEDLSTLAFVELISPGNTAVLRKKILLQTGQGTGDMMIPENLQTGIYYLLVYTNWMKNFEESSFCKQELLIINPSQAPKVTETKNVLPNPELDGPANNSSLSIIEAKSTYPTRSLITLKLNDPELTDNLSISVYRKEPSMIYRTAVKEDSSPVVPDKILFLPDYRGIRVGGNITDISGKGTAGLVTISTPGPGTELKKCTSNEQGGFNFLLKPEEGEKELVISTTRDKSTITLEEPFVNGFRNFPKDLKYDFDLVAMDYLKKKYQHYQFQKGFGQSYFSTERKLSNSKDSSVFYAEPYTKVRLKDYLKLDSLREYFYELVPSVKFNRKNEDLEVSIFDISNYSYLKDKPAVFLDGVLYNNFTAITKIPVSEIDRFVVIPREYYFMDMTFGGIIDIHTKKSDFNAIPLLKNMTRIIYPLANGKEWKFTSPDYTHSGSNSRIPDFRYLLYWEPNLNLKNKEKTISFFTSDIKGSFLIKITGLTEHGIIKKFEKEITVKD